MCIELKMEPISQTNLILIIILVCATLLLVYIVYSKKKNMEHFSSPESGTKYENRMNVMKIFNTVLDRKPTLKEIEKYADIDNEHDMLNAIMADNEGAEQKLTKSNESNESNDSNESNENSRRDSH